MKPFRLSLLLGLLLAHVTASAALAHPLGNFTINHSATLRVGREAINVEYVLDMAEIPAFQEVQALDANRNGQLDPAEINPYRSQQCGVIGSQLALRVSGQATPLALTESAISFPAGAGNLPTLRLICQFRTPVQFSAEGVTLDFSANVFPGRLGWREIVVIGEGVRVEGDFARASISQQLAAYPEDMLASPLDERQITVMARLDASVSSPENTAPALTGETRSDAFTQLITLPELTPLTLLAAFGVALMWGAAHALTPGHGKTIVGAYLVGARGTAKHALYLGFTTTMAHTAGVFALGLITLFASEYILPETLFPWLSVLSSLLVVGLGVSLLVSRVPGLRARPASPEHDANVDHEHGPNTHTHLPPTATSGPVTWRSILALGVSGGLIPCPSALVVLLGAIALNRLGLGLLLVFAFSIGLAGALTLIGLALVYARQWFDRFPMRLNMVRYVSVGSAAFITLAGLGMVAQALVQLGLITL